MANIHAGEVEGKKRRRCCCAISFHPPRKLRGEMVILIAPIYNADGNEKISTEHRKTQNGPPNGVGVRENAQGLDLNRDYMKLESPEARGLISQRAQPMGPAADCRPSYDQRLVSRLRADLQPDAQS